MLNTATPLAWRRSTPCPGDDSAYLAAQEEGDARDERFDRIAERAEASFLRELKLHPEAPIAAPWERSGKATLAEVIYQHEAPPAEAVEVVQAMSLLLRGDEAGALAKLREAIGYMAQRYADDYAEQEA
ncbi:hypothetical protein [uncultured Aquabacterium sp.]|uniref:hypothetical protein n=1 Tax=uncultured Aquabacterium sp. TaxID=158753 RepID=UPI0025DE936B|nr:hypothetical protein [uncultured Aquabacterium sp.]